MIPQLEALLKKSRDVRKQGGSGVAIAFIQSGSILNVTPLGIADRITPRDAYNPRWLDKLRADVQGRSTY